MGTGQRRSSGISRGAIDGGVPVRSTGISRWLILTSLAEEVAAAITREEVETMEAVEAPAE